ncbi:uncharacterized protein [Hyperolius riggenbachi]|uniref:uncharacterized protein n=1 Tax=Hyperolius riggenbachi TaxID=752182 RepID=UPI0035A31135
MSTENGSVSELARKYRIDRQKSRSEVKPRSATGNQMSRVGVSVTQLDELIGVPGEEVIIPCHYPEEDTDPAQEVTWYIPETPHTCRSSLLNMWTQAEVADDRFSLVKFPHDVSLRIHEILTEDYQYYCCEVTTARRGRLLSKQITKLIIASTKNPSTIFVNQPAKTTVQEGDSVILNCSCNIDNPSIKREVVGLSAYWRVGNKTGPYAYHPHQEMVHPNYKERATLTGALDLFIEGVQMADNTSFYCFVVIKRHTKEDKYQDDIQYGTGTKLYIQANTKADQRNIITITCVTALIILILVIFGFICKKKRKCSDQQMDAIHDATDKGHDVLYEEMPYCVITGKDKIHYATLDQTKLKGGPKTRRPEKKENVEYADVVKTTS